MEVGRGLKPKHEAELWTETSKALNLLPGARVAEPVYATDLKSVGLTALGVRVSPRAPNFLLNRESAQALGRSRRRGRALPPGDLVTIVERPINQSRLTRRIKYKPV